MALDMNALRAKDQEIKSRSTGDNNMFYLKDIKDEKEVRILPPNEAMNGLPYVEQKGWWIDGKFYQSNVTFGGKDVIEEELNEAKASGDADILELVNKKKNGIAVLKSEYRYLIPALCFTEKEVKGDTVYTVDDDRAKIIVCKPSLVGEINKLFTNKRYQNGTPDGILDLKKGWNVILTKTGSGKETEYGLFASPTTSVVDPKWVEEANYPDPVAYTERIKASNRHLRSVIRNYLYGEDIIEDPKKETKAETKPAPKKPRVDEDDAPVAKKPAKRAQVEDDDEEAPVAKKPAKKAQVEDDEDEAPKAKPKSKAGKRSLIDDAETAEDNSDLDD